ncbi:hypothetical protein WISP_148732 [Willisornis vidua]|uniref:Uncharacterized protein n=1 Tax=Willisornis vidua TaxID=1566151 RepID=A0ABQ9CQ87_9PASS|nr:hypothetical protein WISP_148732 [Willisornis vidua]
MDSLAILWMTIVLISIWDVQSINDDNTECMLPGKSLLNLTEFVRAAHNYYLVSPSIWHFEIVKNSIGKISKVIIEYWRRAFAITLVIETASGTL